jgi:hypothetical protein
VKNVHDARRIARGHNKPRPETIRKLQGSLRQIVEELKQNKKK